MKFVIGAYDPSSRSVPVNFDANGVEHDRRVNACHDKTGAYDAQATIARVEQVALGVAVKMDLGVITAAAEPAPASVEEDAPAIL
jgi:hypothetical protein